MVGERPPAGPDLSTLYCRPLAVVTMPALPAPAVRPERLAPTLSGDSPGCSVGSGTASTFGLVWQPVASRRSAEKANRKNGFMVGGGYLVSTKVSTFPLPASRLR